MSTEPEPLSYVEQLARAGLEGRVHLIVSTNTHITGEQQTVVQVVVEPSRGDEL